MLKSNKYKIIKKCRLCSSNNLIKFINFSNVPLGNNLLNTKKEALEAEEYPLEVLRCKNCNHFQLKHSVSPKILYTTNYTYLSGVGSSFIRHIHSYVDWVEKKTHISKSSFVVDVGSNDGTCLKVFKDKGYKVCGVDPAKLPANIANTKGIFTINDFFNKQTVDNIIKKFGNAELITSQNVLAHINDLQGTFKLIYSLLKENGYFVFEIGYFRSVLETGCFDTIYHEHLDYHQGGSLIKFLSSIGFQIISINVNKIQGGSLRLLLRKTKKKILSKNVQKFILDEKNSILFNEIQLKDWSNRIYNVCNEINGIIKKEKQKNILCYAYGSPTKASLLLKMSGLSSTEIEFIVEDNEHKVGKYLPKLGIPILSFNELNFNKNSLIFILAWNFSDDIIRKIKSFYKVPVKIIIPLPELKVIEI